MPEIKSPRESLAEISTITGHENSNGQEQSWRKAGSSLGSIVAGGALAVYGASRKSAGGTALATAGSLLALRGIRRAVALEAVHVERSFTINRPVNEVFSYFRNFENLPKFMYHLKHVRVTGPRTSHWVARVPLGIELAWDAEIVEEKQDRYLAWQSLPGTVIPNRGAVQFRAASDYHGGTEIILAMDYAPPAGRGGAVFARVFGQVPGKQLREDLRRLKRLLETGEVCTTEGQSHGRRTAFVRMMQAVSDSANPKARHSAAEGRPRAMGG
jgi:uncharacterized membrane protein